MLSGFVAHDVDDDVEVVEDDPVSGGGTVAGVGAEAELELEFLDEVIDEGAEVGLAGCGGEDEEVGDG